MLLRSLVSIVSLVAVLGAIALQFVYPGLQLIIFYVVLVWVLLGFFIYRLPIMSRQVGRTRPASALPAPSAAPNDPLGGGAPPPAGTSAGALGFCLYCGSIVDPGTALCPSCGRSLPLA